MFKKKKTIVAFSIIISKLAISTRQLTYFTLAFSKLGFRINIDRGYTAKNNSEKTHLQLDCLYCYLYTHTHTRVYNSTFTRNHNRRILTEEASSASLRILPAAPCTDYMAFASEVSLSYAFAAFCCSPSST